MWRQNGCKLKFNHTGEGVNNLIVRSTLVFNFIVISNDRGKPSGLCWGGDWLLQQIFKALLICADYKLFNEKIWAPFLN